jgi:hypothetical protein
MPLSNCNGPFNHRHNRCLLRPISLGCDHRRRRGGGSNSHLRRDAFSINTDVQKLIAQDLPWHARQVALTKAFPQKAISAVVTAPTPENAEQATDELAHALKRNPDLFPKVAQPDSGDFFDRNQLLLAPASEVKRTVGGLAQAGPILSQLSHDPSLRGVMNVLSFAAGQVRQGRLSSSN